MTLLYKFPGVPVTHGMPGLGGTDLRCAGCKWAASYENVNKR